MDRTRFVTHQGQQILLVDLSGLGDPAEIVRWLDRAQELLVARPRGSVRYCLDVADMRFNTQVIKRFREGGARSRPHMHVAAIAGLSGIQRASYKMITFALKLPMPDFATRAEALDWLAAQP